MHDVVGPLLLLRVHLVPRIHLWQLRILVVDGLLLIDLLVQHLLVVVYQLLVNETLLLLRLRWWWWLELRLVVILVWHLHLRDRGAFIVAAFLLRRGLLDRGLVICGLEILTEVLIPRQI